MTKETILALSCKKHIKIYKLAQLGLKNGDIAKLVGTNPGHVYNALKSYDNNPQRVKIADDTAGENGETKKRLPNYIDQNGPTGHGDICHSDADPGL